MRRKGLILLALVLLTLPTVAAMLPTTTSAAASTTYWKVNINIVGNGTLTVILDDLTKLPPNSIINKSVITHSTSFLVPNGTAIYLESNQSFVVNNQGMITKEYGQLVIDNTTLVVNFNIENVTLPISEYVKVNIILNNSGNLSVVVGNWQAQILYTNITIDKTTTLLVPPGSIVILRAISLPFLIDNYSMLFNSYTFFATEQTTVIVTFVNYKPNYTSTSYTSTSTTTINNTSTNTGTNTNNANKIVTSSTLTNTTIITIPVHTSPILPTTSSENEYISVIPVVVVAIAIMLIIYLIIKRNNRR